MSIIENAVRRLGQDRGVGNQASRARAHPSYVQNLAAVDAPAELRMPAAEPAQPGAPASGWRSGIALPGASFNAGRSHLDATPPDPLAPAQKGFVDLERLERLGAAVPNLPRSTVAEEFRVIKRKVLQAMEARRASGQGERASNFIMFTSSRPGEGKTWCSVNLALSLAMEKDYGVLLIDADVARPSVPSLLGMKADQGLTDVLRSDGPRLDQVLVATNLPGLMLLPSGKPQRDASELLSSRAMDRLVEEIARRGSNLVVIVDSPPLLATSEPLMLTRHMGQIVMVVEAGKTVESHLMESIRLLEGYDNVTLLYNKARRLSVSTDYGPY